MASIRHDIHLSTDPAAAWDAVRDFGAVHERVAPGFVTACQLDGADRVLTFVNGAVARERLVGLDDEHRRLVYTLVESALEPDHHQGTVEIRPVPGDPGACVLEWTTDVLPDRLTQQLGQMMAVGAEAIGDALRGAGVAERAQR